MITSIDELSPEQLESLTGEQITAIEENPEKIDEILNLQEGKVVQATPDPDTTKQAVEKKAAPDAVEKEPVLLNKSESGTIPYSTLQESRKKSATLQEDKDRLEQELADANTAKDEAIAEATTLAKAKEEAIETGTPAEQVQAQEDFDAHMKVLEEDFPEQHALVQGIVAKNEKLSGTVRSLSERLEKIETQSTDAAKETKAQADARHKAESLEAVDNNPELANWRENDQAAYDEAVKQDDALRFDPVWGNKTYIERYAEAVRKTKLVMPDASKPPKLTGQALKDAELAAKAKEKVDKLAGDREITTLSDIQGAEGASLSKQEELDNMDTLDMTARLMKMSPEEQTAYRAGGD